MPSINEVIERVNRARPDAIDDETAADRFKINFKANTDDLQDAMQTLEGLDADERARGQGTRRRLSHLRRDGNHL